jgi:hypothetical protein
VPRIQNTSFTRRVFFCSSNTAPLHDEDFGEVKDNCIRPKTASENLGTPAQQDDMGAA